MSEKRKEKRSLVAWPVHVRGTSLSLVGAGVCDISKGGTFLRATEEQAAKVKEGEALVVTLFPMPLGRGHVVPAVVEWAGQSKEHHDTGIGLSFTDPGRVAALIDDARRLKVLPD